MQATTAVAGLNSARSRPISTIIRPSFAPAHHCPTSTTLGPEPTRFDAHSPGIGQIRPELRQVWPGADTYLPGNGQHLWADFGHAFARVRPNFVTAEAAQSYCAFFLQSATTPWYFTMFHDASTLPPAGTTFFVLPCASHHHLGTLRIVWSFRSFNADIPSCNVVSS